MFKNKFYRIFEFDQQQIKHTEYFSIFIYIFLFIYFLINHEKYLCQANYFVSLIYLNFNNQDNPKTEDFRKFRCQNVCIS